VCRTDDYPPHDYGYPCPCYDCVGPHADADRYTEALTGARAMRDRARTWADYTDTPAIRPGADATERRHGIPPWPAIDTE
jgi:hypothetical protein